MTYEFNTRQIAILRLLMESEQNDDLIEESIEEGFLSDIYWEEWENLKQIFQ